MSVEFDPVRLERRRRRVEPAVVGIVVAVLGIGAAIAKPWEVADTGPGPGPTSAANVAADGTPAPSVAPKRTPRPTPEPPNYLDIAGAVTQHDAWGIAAVLRVRRSSNGLPVSPPTDRYLERWTPTSADSTAGNVAYVNRDDRPITALGITVPAGVQARSVRIWRQHAGDAFEWVDAARIDDAATPGMPLLIRLPLADDAVTTPWDAGHYRVDVLTADGIHRISVLIPNRFGNVPTPDVWTATVPDAAAAEESDPSGIQAGLFATIEGGAVSIPARESGPLGEAQAWGDDAVVATYLPRATGLGVMLTSHAAVEAASIRRLAPEPLSNPPVASGGISNMRGRTPFVVFPAPDGVWTPGVYAVSVDWTDAAGPHHATWHVELRPGVV